jgi:hypothetical protein
MAELKNHPAVRIARDSFARFREGKIDAAGLQQNLSTALGLLDNSLPKAVQESISWAENEIEGVRFMTNAAEQPAEVDRVWREVQEVLARHDSAE